VTGIEKIPNGRECWLTSIQAGFSVVLINVCYFLMLCCSNGQSGIIRKNLIGRNRGK